MVTSDMLLHLIADLQGDMSVTHGRRTLLKYAQTTSGARLALLFVFHKEHQTLVLLERYSQRPQRVGSIRSVFQHRGSLALHCIGRVFCTFSMHIMTLAS